VQAINTPLDTGAEPPTHTNFAVVGGLVQRFASLEFNVQVRRSFGLGVCISCLCTYLPVEELFSWCLSMECVNYRHAISAVKVK
jgi:hypothetical protein